VAAPSPLEHQQLEVAADPTYWHRVRFELVIGEARRAGCRRVLDFGAGSGMLGDYVHHNHRDLAYSFTETSPVLRARLVERFGPDAEAYPNDPIQAETVVAMLDVVEHIEDDVAALAELHEQMAPGARLIVTVPAMSWAYSAWDAALGHFRRYGRATLAARLRDAGFTDVTTAYLFPELFPLLIVRRLRRVHRAHADFPPLGPTANAVGYRIASLTTDARRIWPFGTSVFAVATRTR
jgi:SAM-dependent methyltransferase